MMRQNSVEKRGDAVKNDFGSILKEVSSPNVLNPECVMSKNRDDTIAN